MVGAFSRKTYHTIRGHITHFQTNRRYQRAILRGMLLHALHLSVSLPMLRAKTMSESADAGSPAQHLHASRLR